VLLLRIHIIDRTSRGACHAKSCGSAKRCEAVTQKHKTITAPPPPPQPPQFCGCGARGACLRSPGQLSHSACAGFQAAMQSRSPQPPSAQLSPIAGKNQAATQKGTVVTDHRGRTATVRRRTTSTAETAMQGVSKARGQTCVRVTVVLPVWCVGEITMYEIMSPGGPCDMCC
jgi:hypothetical protein